MVSDIHRGGGGRRKPMVFFSFYWAVLTYPVVLTQSRHNLIQMFIMLLEKRSQGYFIL